MCTWENMRLDIDGAGRARSGWVRLERADVYYDHPYAMDRDHTLNIDFRQSSGGQTAERIAVELSGESAWALAAAIIEALEAGERATGERTRPDRRALRGVTVRHLGAGDHGELTL